MKPLYLRIRKFALHNKGFKAASLVVAVVTWYAIQPAISFETVVSDVPIRVIAEPGWAVLDQSVSTADVHVRGSRETIRSVERENPEITVDIRGRTHAQTLQVSLGPRNVRLPPGARVMYVRPAEISIQLDQEVDKIVPVKAQLQGSPPEGYEVDRLEVIPATVSISGPRQRLEGVETVRTLPIEMEGRTQPFKQRVGIAAPSPTWVARIEPERVAVDVTVVEHTATRTIEDVRIKVLGLPGLFPPIEIHPSRITVVLQGQAEALKDLTARDIRVFVDGTGLEPATRYELPVQWHLPPQIRMESAEPSSVVVRVGER